MAVPPAHNPFPWPAAFYEAMAAIDNDVGLTPARVLDAADSPQSPLYHHIEWDNAVCGLRYRQRQARGMIAAFRRAPAQLRDDDDDVQIGSAAKIMSAQDAADLGLRALVATMRSEPGARVAACLRDALSATLGGDEFGIAQLTMIENIARSGKALLQAVQGHDPLSLGRHNGGTGAGGAFYSNLNLSDINLPNSVSNPAETFGAKALRELGGLLQKMTGDRKRSRRTVMRELAVAREEGLDDVADELKQELRDMRDIDGRLTGEKDGIVQTLSQPPAEPNP